MKSAVSTLHASIVNNGCVNAVLFNDVPRLTVIKLIAIPTNVSFLD